MIFRRSLRGIALQSDRIDATEFFKFRPNVCYARPHGKPFCRRCRGGRRRTCEFLMGFIMACIGGYLLANQVTVVGSYWSYWGANSFGITLIPMLFGAFCSGGAEASSGGC